MSRKTGFLVTLALVVGCGGPAGSDVASRADASSATVDPGIGRLFITTGDPDGLLFVVVGATLENARAICEGGSLGEFGAPVTRTRLFLPEATGTDVGLYHAGGELPALVFEAPSTWTWSEAFAAFDATVCETALTTEPIATGTVHYGYSTNDNYWSPDANRVTAWRFTVEGTVYDANGDALHLVHAGHCTMRVPGDFSTLDCRTNVTLR